MRRVEFRDGLREVPDHVADQMEKFVTHTLTYEQAIDRVNQNLLRDRLASVQQKVVRDHVARFGIE